MNDTRYDYENVLHGFFSNVRVSGTYSDVYYFEVNQLVQGISYRVNCFVKPNT